MSEILFKGKRKDNGEWVEGDLINNYDGRKFIGEIIIENYKGPCVDEYEISNGLEEVIPETVEQCIVVLSERKYSPLYKFHYSSIGLKRWATGCWDKFIVEDVIVYADNLENADKKCFDLVKYKIVNNCEYDFKTYLKSICEIPTHRSYRREYMEDQNG